MLLWHKHDVEKSLADLANFTPFPDEWTVEDKVLFEQAFSFHGKSFARIQQMVRDTPCPPKMHPQTLHHPTPPPPGGGQQLSAPPQRLDPSLASSSISP